VTQSQDEFPFYLYGAKKTQSLNDADGAKVTQSQDEFPFYLYGTKKTQSLNDADAAKVTQSQDEFPFYLSGTKKTQSLNDADAAKVTQSQDEFPFYLYGAKKTRSLNDANAAKVTQSQDEFPFYLYGTKKTQSLNDADAAKVTQPQDEFPFYLYGAKKTQSLNDADGAKVTQSQDEFPFYLYGAKKTQSLNDADVAKVTQSQDEFPFYLYGAKKTQSLNDADAAKVTQSQDQFSLLSYGAKETQSYNDANALLPKIRHATNNHQLHEKPKAGIIFLEEDLQPGKTLEVPFVKRKYTVPLLPRQVTQHIPFSLGKMKEILEMLAVKPNSKNAEIVEKTIGRCEAPPMDGEEKYCATSLESMVDFITSKLGKNVRTISTEVERETKLQIFLVKDGMKKLADDNMVACHPMSYPYVVFWCHELSETVAYFMPLEGEDGARVKAIAVCHKDTSKWDPNHLAFQVLKVKPGTVPVCHFFPEGHLLWLAK
ncbi:BURP domain, partial [Sesbania bispinosa]